MDKASGSLQTRFNNAGDHVAWSTLFHPVQDQEHDVVIFDAGQGHPQSTFGYGEFSDIDTVSGIGPYQIARGI